MFEISGKGKPLTSRIEGKTAKKDRSTYNKKKKVTRFPRIVPVKASPTKNEAKNPPTKGVCPPVKQLTLVEEAEKLLAEEDNPFLNGTGHIRVRFNHYNKLFPIHNGVLRWAAVDEEYCISFVFKGDFTRDLQQELGGEGRDICLSDSLCRRDEKGVYFLGLTAAIGDSDPVTYRLSLLEDPVAGVGAEGLRLREGPLLHDKTGTGTDVRSGNSAVGDITKSLLDMKASDLHSQEAKDLRERRDLEDILYS